MASLQIGVCNGHPVIIDVPASGLLPINYREVELRYDFYKDAPESYRPLKFINGRPGQYGKTWGPYLPGQAGYPGTDKADWMYPYMESEAAALVALGVASYYEGRPVDVDHRGRPALNLSLAFFSFTSKTPGHATFSITTSSSVRGETARLYRVAAGGQFDPDDAILCASTPTSPLTTYQMTAVAPAGVWDFYAVPVSLGGQVGIRSGPITVTVT